MFSKEKFNRFFFRKLTPFHWAIIFIAFIAIHLPAIIHCHVNDNVYVILARSFEDCKLNLEGNALPMVPNTQVRNTGDLIFYEGKYYLPYPPGPAILLIPFLWIFGTVNSVLIAVLLGCLSIFLLHLILKKLKIQANLIPWLICGFIFGTGYWFTLLTSHHVYGFAEVVSVTAILLFLNELLGKQRAVLMGIFLGGAFLCRQFTIVLSLFALGYLIYYYYMLPETRNVKVFWRKVILFSGSTGVSVMLYLIYNYLRFGNPLDAGYRYINFLGVLKERVAEYGVFSGHYVLYNLYNYLIKGFNIEFMGNQLLSIKGMDLFGSALLVASPFLVSAFKSGWHRFLRVFAWITIGIIFTGLLFYHNNGEQQVNTSRFTLDFLPLMFILTALGADKLPPWLFKSMVIYAITINIVAFIIHLKYHTFQA